MTAAVNCLQFVGWDDLNQPKIAAKGFREYDGRWLYPDELNLPGAAALGAGLGTLMHESGAGGDIILGRDFRSYSHEVANAIALGLVESGVRVIDIGTVISPMAYFSRAHFGVDAVAMVTASHNPNGWTGVKAGIRHPHTLSGCEISRLRQIVLEGPPAGRAGGGYRCVSGIPSAYADDLTSGYRFNRRLKAVCATGNGTVGRFAPDLLRQAGMEIVPLHAELDCGFPNYNPNPESVEMLADMGRKVRETGADIGFGFDGDGDRLGVVDNQGNAVFSDKIGVIIARSIAERHRKARFVADVKSTALFSSDPVLLALGASTDYWKTGHSHMKLRVEQTGALAGFEKSGHFYFAPPVGRGYDDACLAALEVGRLLDREANSRFSDLVAALPKTWMTPTMSPSCSDGRKYQVTEQISKRLTAMCAANGTLAGQRIQEVLTVNGARCVLANGSWGLVRASSNTPNLVVVCESVESASEMRAIFADLDRLLREEGVEGDYDQRI